MHRIHKELTVKQKVNTLFFTFKKIRETRDAFKSKGTLKSKDEFSAIAEYVVSDYQLAPQSRPNIATFLIVFVPIVWLGTYALESLLESCGTAKSVGRDATILTGFYIFIYAFCVETLQKKILQKIQFHKLNPYFGKKLQETIRAFKKPRAK